MPTLGRTAPDRPSDITVTSEAGMLRPQTATVSGFLPATTPGTHAG